MADPTRDAAYDLLNAVLDRHRSLEAALDGLPAAIAPRDRAAGHRIAAAVLRRTGSLDAVLEPYVKREPPTAVRHILRLGAAQLLLLDTPPHAAVATAVALARTKGLQPFAALINAVLRRVAEAGPTALADLDAPRLDTPAWLWTSWGSDARAIAEGHAIEAPIDITVKGVVPPGGVELPNGSIRFPAGTRVPDVPGYADGDWWVQDAAASLPARLLVAQRGETVVDLCAAPGGKAAQLATTGAHVTALDRDGGRIARLRENLSRLRVDATIVQADASTWTPPTPVDAVLLDAPCTATGTVRRHPDVLHLKRPRDVQTLAAQQAALIAHAATILRPGGRLIFAVCSLQPEEGIRQLATAAACGLRHDPFGPAELSGMPEVLDANGCLHTHPGLWRELGGMDGFFAARFIRD